MKALLRAVDRFCGRHPRFGIPNLMLYVVIANAIVWLFQMMDTTGAPKGSMAKVTSRQTSPRRMW